MSGTNFIMMVIMILILLFVLMNIGPLVDRLIVGTDRAIDGNGL